MLLLPVFSKAAREVPLRWVTLYPVHLTWNKSQSLFNLQSPVSYSPSGSATQPPGTCLVFLHKHLSPSDYLTCNLGGGLILALEWELCENWDCLSCSFLYPKDSSQIVGSKSMFVKRKTCFMVGRNGRLWDKNVYRGSLEWRTVVRNGWEVGPAQVAAKHVVASGLPSPFRCVVLLSFPEWDGPSPHLCQLHVTEQSLADQF